jgi:hypothetical protein
MNAWARGLDVKSQLGSEIGQRVQERCRRDVTAAGRGGRVKIPELSVAREYTRRMRVRGELRPQAYA